MQQFGYWVVGIGLQIFINGVGTQIQIVQQFAYWVAGLGFQISINGVGIQSIKGF